MMEEGEESEGRRPSRPGQRAHPERDWEFCLALKSLIIPNDPLVRNHSHL